jgi:hypothetical protein
MDHILSYSPSACGIKFGCSHWDSAPQPVIRGASSLRIPDRGLLHGLQPFEQMLGDLLQETRRNIVSGLAVQHPALGKT